MEGILGCPEGIKLKAAQPEKAGERLERGRHGKIRRKCSTQGMGRSKGFGWDAHQKLELLLGTQFKRENRSHGSMTQGLSAMV